LTRLFPQGCVEEVAKDYGIPFIGKIPLDPNFMLCCEEGRNILEDHPSSSSALSLMELANTINTLILQ
jgi:MinD superfamily P-loop ATPase